MFEFKGFVLKLITNSLRAIAFFYCLLAASVVSSAELAKGSSTLEVAGSKTDSSRDVKLNSLDFSNDTDVLNNIGIIEDSDFSKEVASSSLDKKLLPAGFYNKVILTSSVDYDSNPAFVSGRKNPVWIYTLSPQLILDYTGEFNKFYLDSAIVIQRPSNGKVLPDREDPRLNIGWDRTYESGNYGVYASYSQFLSRAQEIRTRGTFSAVVDGESTQRARGFGAKWEHDLSQRWGLSTNADLRKESFSGGVNLIGSTTLDLKSTLKYAYSERLNTNVQFGYVEVRPDKTLEDTELIRIALGSEYLFSDDLTGVFRVGKNYVSGAESDSDWTAGAKFTYLQDRMEYFTELNREVSVAGGIGGFQKIDTLALGWSYTVSEKDTLSTTCSFVRFDSQAGSPGQKFKQFGAAYNHALSGNWNARANLSYRLLVPEDGGSNAEEALLGVSLIYNGLSF